MYHTLASECQTQFPGRQDAEIAGALGVHSFDFPRSDPSVACRRTATLPEASQSFTFSNPATASPALRLSAIRS
jgi:hypothetical protein